MCRLRAKSRTVTAPAVTFVRVPSQRSAVSQVVPLIAAELKRPRVRNFPLPDPQSLRTVFPPAAADAERGRQRANDPPLRTRSVRPFPALFCATLKTPE